MRKVSVILTVKLDICVNEGVEIGDIINEMDYSFVDTTTEATIEDSTIEGFYITNSK